MQRLERLSRKTLPESKPSTDKILEETVTEKSAEVSQEEKPEDSKPDSEENSAPPQE